MLDEDRAGLLELDHAQGGAMEFDVLGDPGSEPLGESRFVEAFGPGGEGLGEADLACGDGTGSVQPGPATE
jgi:hypothetical protein